MKAPAWLIIFFLLTPSFILKTQAQKTDTTYWWNDAVFYEAFVRSFYDTNGDGIGDFNGLTAKLDYIQSLGANAIWLMPVCPSPSYHGYDITDYKGFNADYGTRQDYANFITAAHSRGMKVIFDMVANHTSNQHPWFQQSSANDTSYRSFYRWSTTNPNYDGPWGEQVWDPLGNSHNNYYYGVFTSEMPDLNYINPIVEDSMFSVIDFWLDTMLVDGFRCDAAEYIIEDGERLQNTPETIQFWKSFHSRYVADNPNAMAVGEVWQPDDTILEFTGNGGMDFCFQFNLQGAIINAANSGDATGLANEFQYIYSNFPFAQYGNFISNHDMDRSFDQLGDYLPNAKLAAAIYLTLPGVPFVYYGEEIGMTGSNNNPAERTPMQWTNGSNAGFTTGTPWEAINGNYQTYNVATELPDSASLLNWYKQLIAIRRANPVLCRGTYFAADANYASIFSFIRSYNGQNALVVINCSNSNYTNQSFSFHSSAVTNGVKFVTELISDTSFVATINNQTLTGITVPANSSAIYLLTDTTVSTGVVNIPDANNMQFSVYPNPSSMASVQLSVGSELIGSKLEVYDDEGKLVFTSEISSLQSEISTANLSSGVYFIYLKSESGVAVKKVIVAK